MGLLHLSVGHRQEGCDCWEGRLHRDFFFVSQNSARKALILLTVLSSSLLELQMSLFFFFSFSFSSFPFFFFLINLFIY